MRKGLLAIATAAVIGLGTGITVAEGPKRPPPERRNAQVDREREMYQIRQTIEKLARRRDQLIDKKGVEEDHPEIRELDKNIERLERELDQLEQPRHRPGREPEHAREMDQIREKIEDLARRRDQLIDKKGLEEGHPEVRELDRNIERLERELEERERRTHRPGRHPHLPGPGTFHPKAGRLLPSPEVLEKLEAVLPEIEFDEVPFGQAIQFLRELKKVNINVEWRALEAVDVDQETPVNLDPLTNVPLGMVLKMVLRSVADERDQLGFYVEGNVVVITLADHLPRPGPPPQMEEILERLRHDRPEVFERLMELRREHPEHFREELVRLGRVGAPPPDEEQERREREEFRRHHPERFKLMQHDEELTDRTVELAERIRRTEASDEKGKLRDQLAELLSRQFDVRMEIRRHEIKGVARELDELRAALERRVKNKRGLVERRMNELLNPEETEW